MSISETHSDQNLASDDEDFKGDIPYYEEVNTETQPRSTSAGNEPSPYNYPPWEHDDQFMEDNNSRLGSDYSTYSSGETPNPPPNYFSPLAKPAESYHQDDRLELKYMPPNEMVLHPPSSAALHYNYTRHQRQLPPYPPQPPPPPPQHNFTHPQAHPHASSSVAVSPYAEANQTPPYGHQPNMWYPNAPYGAAGYYRQYGSQRYAPYGAGGYHSHDPMMDMLHLSNSGREARNRAEKNRRDKLNGSIQELSTMVPHVAESPRRVDKTAVLRFAAHGLRLQYVFGDAQSHERPELTDSLMKLLDSFFITLTCHGQIVLISSSVEQHLGHCQADLYGQNILHITHPEDHATIKQQLIPTDLERLFDVHPEDSDSGQSRQRTAAEEDHIDRKLREDKRSFTVRLARAGPRSEPTAYEVVRIEGSFRRSDSAPRGIKTSTFPSSLQLIRRTRGREDSMPLHTISGNDIVLIAIARVIRPPKIVNRLTEIQLLAYKTRHLIDGCIIDCDQKIGIVAGYMTDEVRNLSPFTFIHKDDVRWVIVALRQMYDCHSSYGESVYRLFTRNGHFIYLESKAFLEIDKDSNKVHTFMCVNTLLDEQEGQRRLLDMKKKFSVIINAQITQSPTDEPASEISQQVEKAVLCLIENLSKVSSGDEDPLTASFGPQGEYTPSVGFQKMHPELLGSHKSSANWPGTSSSSHATRTPPLDLVPPEIASTKTSIIKGANVINVNTGRHLRVQQQRNSHVSETRSEEEEEEEEDLTEKDTNGRASGLKRGCEEQEENSSNKRRLNPTDIERVLSNSLDRIGRTLNQQLNAAIELRDQGNRYEVPSTNERINEIIEEHQMQSELLVNIKSEYEVQRQNNNNKCSEDYTTRSKPTRQSKEDDALTHR